MDHFFGVYHVDQIALTLKACKELIPTEHYREVVEEFADMLSINHPNFHQGKFLDRAGVERPVGEGLRATIPQTAAEVGAAFRARP